MKKMIILMAVLALVCFTAGAQGFVAGGRAGMGIGFHADGDDMEDIINAAESYYGISIDDEIGVNFILAGYGAYYFSDKVALQGELNFMINQNKTWEGSGFKLEGSYSSLDIPVLLRYEFLKEPATIGLLVGPFLSIPLSDIELSGDGGSRDIETDGVTFGITAGLFAGYPFGPGRVIGDVRFLMDFTPLKAKESGVTIEVLKRRSVNITVGYEWSF
jgi:hypothetical protein